MKKELSKFDYQRLRKYLQVKAQGIKFVFHYRSTENLAINFRKIKEKKVCRSEKTSVLSNFFRDLSD